MYSPTTHPIAAFTNALHTELDELASVDPLYLPTATKKAVLVELERARQTTGRLADAGHGHRR